MDKQRMEELYDYPAPHSIRVSVIAEDIDALGHANNAVYLRWLEQVAWSHSQSVGVDFAEFDRLRRAMVARRHELDYLAPCLAGDKLEVCTWVCDTKRAGFNRRYQIIRLADGVTVMRALTRWACINMETGRPTRMPPEFVEAYYSSH